MEQEPAEFVATHLSHELEYMLVAATTWCAAHPDRRAHLPLHLVATAEYAAFVHQRSLYEFFCGSGGAYDARRRLGHARALKSVEFDRWEDDLNTAVMHLWKRWKADPPVIDGDHLKDQVANFALDLVGLWRRFESLAASELGEVLHNGRSEALGQAATAAAVMGAPVLDWSVEDPFVGWGERKWWPIGDG